ncbi:dihydrofolate reductase family protein [Klenkia sp. PcliD-1-E]|uniref:dihydrofolate reductase family protein n=1 Tax=Klenkia sp. PcliD-1-E TaxID=2954492 RepID=UPI0020980452|nr:dihydrofolate reductase family protein [Klenkia sp. PcliD-1-E]MCO7220858.1 dihydrofolate reductase family protein [Klenkia sp. PcliD-1-E]
MELVHPAPARTVAGDDLLDLYPWPDQGRWVRAMMVTALDGAAAGRDGLSGSISSSADREVFDAVRRLADAVLVGAGTLRAEEYGPMRASDEHTERRTAAGQAPAPRLAVVSGSLDLPWELPVWADSTLTPLVLTGPEAADDALATAREHAEVVALPDLEPATLLSALTDRGLRRIVCEGGPSLLEKVVAADLLDEADITLSPVFAGTATTPRTDGPDEVARLDLVHLLTAEGFVMARYTRPGSR